MRNASATFDDDFGFDPPVRKKPARKPGSSMSGKKKKKGKTVRYDRMARYAAIGMSATVVVGIMVNALMMQKGHHPAPLFAKSTPLKDPASSTASASAATEPSAPATPSVPAPVARTELAALKSAPAAPAAKRLPAADPTPTSSGDDAIARLLRTGSPSGAQASGDKADAKTVIAAQKALSKLGFEVKATGTAGPATHKAIEAFEKDRHLPVKGELSRRLIKTLAAESGVRIE